MAWSHTVHSKFGSGKAIKVPVKIKCRKCGTKFDEDRNKPGYRNECWECSKGVKEPPLLGGNMIWQHKTGPEIEIKSLKNAKAFAKKTRRFGAGVTCSLTQSRLSAEKALEGVNPFEGKEEK